MGIPYAITLGILFFITGYVVGWQARLGNKNAIKLVEMTNKHGNYLVGAIIILILIDTLFFK